MMELCFAILVLEKEYTKNPKFELDLVDDKLQFLIALTVVQQGLDNGTLSENDYVKKVIKVLE